MTTIPGRWYPNQPPALPNETDDAYTNRLLSGSVYDHKRNRQCSIGWHAECSDREHSGQCECPHHAWARDPWGLVIQWNAAYPVGTRVVLPLATPVEAPTVTTGPAEVENRGGLNLPMVPLEGFPYPVELAWVQAERDAETNR
jgi:hypothetical protein